MPNYETSRFYIAIETHSLQQPVCTAKCYFSLGVQQDSAGLGASYLGFGRN